MQSYHFGFGNMRLWVINKMLNKSANNYGIAFLSSSGHGSNLITTKIFLRGTAQPAYDVKQSSLFSSKRWPCLSCLVIILLMHRYRTLLMTGSCQRGFCGFSWCHLQTTWCWDLNLGQPWTLPLRNCKLIWCLTPGLYWQSNTLITSLHYRILIEVRLSNIGAAQLIALLC